jgi:DNA-binding transcriptional LysR family regulator
MVIRQLLYLTALARERHFGRAAEACNVTQPTLSAGIRELEEDLGVPVVERGRSFRGLTPEGERVLEWSRRILADCDGLRQDIGLMKKGLTGRLRIGAVPSALPVVSLVTGPFARRHPLVTISVLSMTSAEVVQGLADFELDAGITYLDAEPIGHVRSLRLYREDYVLLTSEAERFAGRTSVTWREAAELPLCLLTPNMQNRRIIDGVFRSVGRVPVPAVETNSIVNLCAHVRSGPWSSVMPRALLHLFGVPAGTRALRMVEPEVHKTIGLVASEREPASPVAATLFAMADALAIDDVLGAVALA